MKRSLRPEEIDYILECIQPQPSFPEEIGTQICAKIRDQCRVQLAKIQLYPECIEELCQSLVRHYDKCQVQAGLNVGILSAQSAGERQTQLVLNSFHSAGQAISTVVSGVPRFAELLNATKKPKNVITNIYFREPIDSIGKLRRVIGSDIVGVRFGDLVEHTEMCESMDFWSRGKRVCRYYLRQDKLYTYRITLKSIVDKLPKKLAIYRSPDIYGIIDVAEEQSVPDQHLFGVSEISNVLYKKDPSGTWCIEALGYNLEAILAIPSVDSTKTLSNHMWEIFTILGTEAVRQFLIDEFTTVISTDAYISPRNINLLVDVMMYTGSISSISRYGVHRNQSSVLTKSSFEESLDQFLTAALYGDVDSTAGVSSSIICGKQSKAGTGLCELMYRCD
jgi:DNA-directed RNA polymerase subunit A"